MIFLCRNIFKLTGQERYLNMTRAYYKDAVGCFIVFDITRVSTFEVRDGRMTHHRSEQPDTGSSSTLRFFAVVKVVVWQWGKV